jgi:hypothetical protein
VAREIFEIEWQGEIFEIEADSEEQAFSALPGYSAPQQSAPPPQEAAPEQDVPVHPGDVPQEGKVSTMQALKATWDFLANNKNEALEKHSMKPTRAQTDRAKGDAALAIAKMPVMGADLAATFGTGIVGAIGGGLAGATAAPFVGMDDAAEVVKGVSDALTWSPKTEYGQNFIAAIAPGMERWDTAVKDVSMTIGLGNPVAATAIETGGNALAMLVGPGAVANSAKIAVREGIGAGAKAGLKAGAKTLWDESMPGQVHLNETVRKQQNAQITKIAEEMQQRAKDLGVELRIDRIHDSLRRVADGMAAESRGQDFNIVANTLRAERLKEKTAMSNAWTNFRNQQHFTDITWAPALARKTAEDLAGRGMIIDSKEAPLVAASLQDIALLPKRITTKLNKAGTGYRTTPENITLKSQSLNELQAIRARINKRARSKAAKDTEQGAALAEIGARLDDMLDQQFRADAAKGTSAPWEAWMKAREATSNFKSRWNEEKHIRNIITDKEMTPEKLAREIIGTSSLLGGPQAARVYNRVMQLTGNNPDVARAIRATVGYDLAKPLLDDFPPTAAAFKKMADNISKFRTENKSLVDAMGYDDNYLKSLQHSARAAQHTKPAEAFGVVQTILNGITRFAVGHEIAQAGFKVKLMQKIIDRMSGVDRTSHKEMLKEFAGIQDEPLTTKIPQQELRKALIRGELANQYQNIGEWDDWY